MKRIFIVDWPVPSKILTLLSRCFSILFSVFTRRSALIHVLFTSCSALILVVVLTRRLALILSLL